MSDIVEKKSAFVSYDGNDEKIKMISDAVNNLTEDVRHESVTFEERPRSYRLRDGDINFSLKEDGIGSPILYYYTRTWYDIDAYEDYYETKFPIRDLGQSFSVYHIDGTNTTPYPVARNYRTCVSFPIFGLTAGSLYTLSFIISSYGCIIDDCLRFNSENPTQFGIVIHNSSKIDNFVSVGESGYYDRIVMPYTYIRNEVFDSYYPEFQYYSFPREWRQTIPYGSKSVSFPFIAYENTYISFILDDLLTKEELIEAHDETWYNNYIKDKPILDFYNFFISNYYVGTTLPVIDKFYSFSENKKTWASFSKDSIEHLHGLSVPENSVGKNGDYYLQYSFSEIPNFTVFTDVNKNWGFISDTIRKDSTGYYLEASYEEDNVAACIDYAISGLSYGKSYLFSYSFSYSETGRTRTDTLEIITSVGPYNSKNNIGNVESSIVAYGTPVDLRIEVDHKTADSHTTLTTIINNLKIYEYTVQDIWYKVEGAWYKYEPQGGGGGGTANVSITPTLLAGTQIASFSIEDQSGTTTGNLYAPTPIQPTEVEANPSGTATDTLTKLDVGGTIYSIPSGGGGSSVTPNPQGDATAALSKLQVENDIYSIPVVSTDTSLPVSSKENDIFFKALEVGVIEHVPSTSQQKTGDASIDHEVVDTSTNSKSVYGQLWDEFDDFIVYSISGLIIGESYTLTFSFVQDGNDIRHNTNLRNCFAVTDRIVYPSTDYGMSGSRDGGTVETLSVGGVTIGKSIIMYYDKTLHSYTLPFTALASTMYVICSPQEWKNGTSYGGVVRNYEWADINISGYSYDNNELYFKKGNSFHKLTIPKTTTLSITPELSAGTKIAEYEIDGVTGELYAPNGGSGGGSGGTRTILYEQEYGENPSTISLSESYQNFDYLIFELWKYDDNSYYDIMPYESLSRKELDAVKDGFKTGRTNCFILTGWQKLDEYARYEVTNTTTFTKLSGSGSWGLRRIVGVDEGGLNITKTTLWTGSLRDVNSTGQLNDIFTRYEYLMLYYEPQDMAYEHHIDIIDTKSLKEGLDNNAGYFSYEYYDTVYIRLLFQDLRNFKVYQRQNSGQCYIVLKKIVGVTVGNKEAEDDGYTKVTLYDGGSDTSYAAYDTSIPLSNDISNYDQLLILTSSEGEGGLTAYAIHIIVDTTEALTHEVGWHGYYKRYMKINFGTTSFTYTGGVTDENADRKPRIYKIFGLKYNTGGEGEGTSNILEMTKFDYNQITPVQDVTYFVYGSKITYMFAHSVQGTTYKYSDVSDVEDQLAVLANLNGTIYAGFFFNTDTRVSTVMSADDLSNFATTLSLQYVTNSTTTLTQDQNTPSLNWRNGSNTDTLYLDATDLTSTGTKCGYYGCISYLFYNSEVDDNSIYLNNRQYSNSSSNVNSSEGNSIIIRTTDPTSSIGSDGDLYLKDTSFGISKIFAKVNGAWKIYNPFIEYEWDFTSSVISNNGTMITLSGATRSSSGITIAGSSQHASIPPTLLRLGYTYEIYISSMSITSSSQNNRLFTYTTNEALNAGLVYRGQSGKWAVWDNTNLWQESTINSKDYFDNSVLKIVIDDSGKWHIYKDDVVVFEPTNALPMVNTAFALGSSSYSVNSTTISAFKIYPNVE